MNVYDSNIVNINERSFVVCEKSLIFKLSHAQKSVYISSCLLMSKTELN